MRTRFSRRALLLSTLALAAPRMADAQSGDAVERDYWPTRRWHSDDPVNQSVDPAMLAQADQIIREGMPDVTGFVVVRGGYLVHERYFNRRYGRTDPVRIRSITKSVTGALMGTALDEGFLASLDQTIGELIPHKIPDGADPLTPAITVRHLLTMTSGWAWDISTDYQRLIASENWLEYTLSQPVIYEPGTFYAYNSGGSHVLSVIVTEVTGREAADYAQEKLFTPLGIARPKWQRSPQGETVGGFGLELTPRNLAKFGYLYLNGGHWDGEQIVPADYVQASTSYQAAGDSTGLAAYGYQWWVTEAYGAPTYFALGFGSQHVYNDPSRDLVVVVVKGFDEPPPLVTASGPFIENFVLPAAPRVG